MTKEDIFRIVEEEDVEFIRLQFTDMFGILKNIAITVSQLEKALNNRFMFDGSSIEGFVHIEDSDMYLHPNLDTFKIFPWRPQTGKVARFICDVYRPDGRAFEGDPRNVLKRAIEKASDKGYKFYVGSEIEFILFSTDEEGGASLIESDKASYFDVGPLDNAENIRRDIVLNLEDMDYEVSASHHEIAPAQHEVDFEYEGALKAADTIMTSKFAIKTIAKKHGLYASFMPKPIENSNGNGLHLNIELRDEKGNNLFIDSDDETGLSEYAYNFMAGILKYMGEMSLLTNPLVNSYKRLVPGFDAPVYIAWSSKSNRSTLIRIPSHRGGETRVEFRCPDTASNPYFVLAACLQAGLRGIEEKLRPVESIDDNLFTLSEKEIKERNIHILPRTLGEAIESFKTSEFMKEVLGEHSFKQYLSAKEKEWKEYLKSVSDWEIKEYLYKY